MAKNTRNPRNQSSGLFQALTKIFSGPIVDRRTQASRHLRRSKMDKYSSRFRSASGQEFKRSRYSDINTTQLHIMNQHTSKSQYEKALKIMRTLTILICSTSTKKTSCKSEI